MYEYHRYTSAGITAECKPRISLEFVTFWLHKFRKLDVRQQSHRKMLIDAFVNAIICTMIKWSSPSTTKTAPEPSHWTT